jgi:hypothetical protein
VSCWAKFEALDPLNPLGPWRSVQEEWATGDFKRIAVEVKPTIYLTIYPKPSNTLKQHDPKILIIIQQHLKKIIRPLRTWGFRPTDLSAASPPTWVTRASFAATRA